MRKLEVQREPNSMKISRNLKGYVRASKLVQVMPFMLCIFPPPFELFDTFVKCCLVPCINRKLTSPAKLCWRSSVKQQNISSPIQQQGLSSPCSTPCPKFEARWIVRATRSPRAFWEKPCQNMVAIWEMIPTLVRISHSSLEYLFHQELTVNYYFQITQVLAYRVKWFICIVS